MLAKSSRLTKAHGAKKNHLKANPISSAWAQLELPKCFDQKTIHMSVWHLHVQRGDDNDSKLLYVKNILSFVEKTTTCWYGIIPFLGELSRNSCFHLHPSTEFGDWYNHIMYICIFFDGCHTFSHLSCPWLGDGMPMVSLSMGFGDTMSRLPPILVPMTLTMKMESHVAAITHIVKHAVHTTETIWELFTKTTSSLGCVSSWVCWIYCFMLEEVCIYPDPGFQPPRPSTLPSQVVFGQLRVLLRFWSHLLAKFRREWWWWKGWCCGSDLWKTRCVTTSPKKL